MKYNFIETDNIKDAFLNKHDLNIDKYLTDFDFSIDEESINIFYNKLLELKDKKFLIVGDYDCDGICSVTIIKRLLKKIGIYNNFYIPSRYKEGYGLNKLIVDNAIKYQIDVILLVDNGVSCFEAIDYAYEKGIKVLIIDHHKFDNKPRCEAFLHQDLLSDEYKYCSAGVLCFLLSLKYEYDDYNLVLAGLTIISDYIIVNSFNRFLLFEMYEVLNNDPEFCLKLLNPNNIYDEDTLKFNIIPKINSISRMETTKFNANHIVKFLLNDIDNISEVAKYMDEINSIRKNEVNKIFEKIISNNYDKNYILICSSSINEGFCSSLATKLSNYYDKAVFVLNESDGVCKGSGRCQNLDIYSLLNSFDNYISFGGHEHAVGLNILSSKLDSFISFLDNLDFSNSKESVEDVYVVDPNSINTGLINTINSLGPFGNGYERPLIGVKNINFPTKVFKDKYTKFFINDKLSAITFEEKYLGYDPKYIFGALKTDNIDEEKYTIIIKALY